MASVGAAERSLQAYGLEHAQLTRITLGHINATYRVDAGADSFILQWLNPIFAPEIHHDIDVATQHLAAQGLTTPRLVRNRQGALWTVDADGAVWRLQTYIAGRIIDASPEPHHCRAAGDLLGQFHGALASAPANLRGCLPGLHDTPQHLQQLLDALARHRGHVAYEQVAPLAEAILKLASALPSAAALPQRLVHGDPKLANIVFAADGRSARALIDLDTLGRMPLVLELGDAWRSWCNPRAEDRQDSGFALDLFEASLEGYARTARTWITPAETDSLSWAVDTIALELAARFARDALEERYFGWDASRYGAAWQHHLARAQGQMQVASAFQAQRGAVQRLLEGALGRGQGDGPSGV